MNEEVPPQEPQQRESRQSVVSRVFLLYTVPILLLSVYAQLSHNSWSLLCLGLLLSVFGSLAFLWILRRWEEEGLSEGTPSVQIVPAEAPPPDFTPYTAQIEAQQKILTEVEAKISAFEQDKCSWEEQKRELQQKWQAEQKITEGLRQDILIAKNNAHDQLEHHKTLIAEQQRTVGELRDTLEKRQQYIQQLEGKTRDLNFELKTLLHLSEKPVQQMSETPMPVEQIAKSAEPVDASSYLDEIVQTPEEAHIHLKRCLDMAQQIMGASHFSNQSRFKEFTLDNFALDLRRLFDRLREVNSSIVLVYAPKENKLLFVNDQVKSLLGVAPEKFMQTFQEQLQSGLEEWKTAVSHLAFKNESKLTLPFKSKSGQEMPFECLLGIVPTGLFRHYVIGLLYLVPTKVTTP